MKNGFRDCRWFARVVLMPALVLGAALAPTGGSLYGQDKAKPKDKSGEEGSALEPGGQPARVATPQASVFFEYYEVDHRMANRLIREYSPRAADAGELREKLLALVEED